MNILNNCINSLTIGLFLFAILIMFPYRFEIKDIIIILLVISLVLFCNKSIVEKFTDDNSNDNMNDSTNDNTNDSTNKKVDNDLEFNELPDNMMKPLGYFDTSYTYMPPWKWWPPSARPPVCVTNKESLPCPITTIGTPTDMKEWDSSRKITPGLGINIEYIKK